MATSKDFSTTNLLGETRNANAADMLQTTVSYTSMKISKTKYEDHVRILASLVPDEIIYRDESQNSGTNYNGVVIFVDVSGFTDMCERYSNLGKGGPSKITQVLNAYIGAMVQEIMSHNGDIMKFSGDAFLALWKCSDDVSMSDVVHAAIDCALGIQRSHGTYKTEVDIILRVKIAMAAGSVTFTIVGDSNFFLLGPTIFDVKALGNTCGPGEIIISPTIKMLISQNEYILENIPNTVNSRILSIGSEWTPSSISNQFELFDAFAVIEQKKTDIDDDSEYVVLDDDEDKPAYCSYILRPSLDYATNRNLNSYLRTFIIPPVVRAIDMSEPLDYLTEMRQVVIVFINCVASFSKIQTLVDVCKTTYNIVCDLVVKGGGCVNKTSMFDKDLMFLVIFGLRGFKHSLEAQKALYCAQNIIVLLKNIPHVDSVSIGVCTGITYCGVVGHPMRKEYTVIGRTVNKAARLMVAYPDIVTCDRQTFLQSQLQARFFTLQPPRYLKGFKSVGPIYKFCDQTTEVQVNEKERCKTKQYPLLDRHKEMELFFYFIMPRQCTSDVSLFSRGTTGLEVEGSCNMMVVKGQERQGKSRLLNEIAFYVNDSVLHNSCCFAELDAKTKYKVFRKTFEKSIGLVDISDTNIRTELVYRFLSPFKVPEFLCGLNDILNVDFEVTKYYLRLTDEQKLFVKRKLIKYLCVKAFKEKCLLSIDNIEYMDKESWTMFKALLNTGLVFVCATLGNYGHIGHEATHILHRHDVKIIKLQPIHKLYHAGMICQFLNVMGVSLELERYIQVHSYGNPGWIESFLTTLSHSEGIRIIELEKKQAQSQGFVIPPYDMLFRQPDRSLSSSSVMLIERREGSFVERFDVDVEDWDIYYQAIKENEHLLSFKTPLKVQVCIIPDGVLLEDLDTEDILDVNMIQTYDSLKVQEQLLLKCSSILGDSFSRKMLEYVMQSQSIRKNGEAIRKLFEIHVFSCARAKYTNGAIQIDHYLTDPNSDNTVECYCTGFPINPITKDLPKYANCGYIRFREPAFRQMLCNLLTDSQANLYHVRSMWYLESQTRRCLACGLGYFTNLIGQSNDDGMKKYSVEQMPSLMGPGMLSGSEKGLYSASDEMQRAVGFGSIKDLKIRPIPAVEKTTNIGLASDIHVRTFADNNLINCECETILITMYKQMIEHCQEAGIHEKLMSALLEYATLCIKSQNITVGFSLLEKATELLNPLLAEALCYEADLKIFLLVSTDTRRQPTALKDVSGEEASRKKLKFEYPEPNWQVPLTRGRIMLLQGQLHIERTAFDEAEKSLINALRCYNLNFPRSNLGIKSHIWINELKQKIMVEYFPHRYIGSRNEDICTLAEQTSEVMSSLFLLYRRKLSFKYAYLASIWGMNEALRSDSNFAVMCHAYSNILTMDLIYRRLDIVKKLEEMALSMCYRKHTRLERHELEAVCRLYGSIFCRKYLCDNMMESLKLGSIVVQLNSPQFGGTARWLMLPMVSRALIFTYLTAQAAILVRQMTHYKHNNQTHFAPMMYYILCLEFKIYTSYSIEPFSHIKSVVIVNLKEYSKKILSCIEMTYHVAIWLWYVRKCDWEIATCYLETISAICDKTFTLELSMVYVFLHMLEGLLLLCVKCINTCDIEGMNLSRGYVHVVLKKLDSITTRLISIRSRYLLYKAYWLMICKKYKEAFKNLDKASLYAKKCGNLYDIDWIEFTRDLWLQPVLCPMCDKWQEASEKEDTDIDWDSIDENIPIPFFSLKLPLK